MCRAYEIMVTAWAMRCSADSPEMEIEARVRLESLLRGGEKIWTLI